MSAAKPKVGDKISINAFSHKGLKGVIRYAGKVEGLVGDIVGIELEEEKGDCAGDRAGVEYFKCDPNKGLFLRATQVKVIKDEPEEGKSPAKKTAAPPSTQKEEAK